jgi:toxin-antitoxin system PIN domain toxin
MTLIDANLLLYAYDPRAVEHDASRRWLEVTLSSPGLVRLAWVTVWAFLRIATSPRVFERPLSVAEANVIVDGWLEQPNVGIIEPAERHREILQRLLAQTQSTGPLVMDAALAAIAIEHGATLYSTDHDFSRFPDLTWINPLG